jgi:uncharacterized protein YgbK (DUF1537 family)
MQTHTRQPAIAGSIFIVADDLTGACDSGVAFVASGRTVRVVLDAESFVPSAEIGGLVLAVTTETRELAKQQAFDRIAQIMALLRNTPGGVLFKKVDSAARGHFASEIIAALDASGAAFALVAPAFPQLGRTVHGGVLHICDAAGQDTTVALRNLFAQIESSHVATVPAGDVSQLEQGIATAFATGVRILLCDAESQADLDYLALAASSFAASILWTGSAGLAHALAATLPTSHRAPVYRKAREGRTLLFTGTDHPVTTLQLSHLDQQPTRLAHAHQAINWSTTSPTQIRADFNAERTASLILTGGETAAYVLRALNARSIVLAGQVAPGIPWGHIEGGDADGCLVVTKSGGFGAHDALADAIHFCSHIHPGRAHATA